MSEPALTPYAGTSGWSGSETSEARARTADADGTTGARQREVLQQVVRVGSGGLTVKELRRRLELHHGQASSTLSVLHKEGIIARLRETRDRCKVYVALNYVDGREIEAPGRTRGTERVLEDERKRITEGIRAIATQRGGLSLSESSLIVAIQRVVDDT